MTKNAPMSMATLGDGFTLDAWPIGRVIATTPQQCSCGNDVIHAFRAYLRGHFPHYAVRDFHERARVTQSGLPIGYSDHHVVSVTDWHTAYYAVLSSELLARPLPDLRERLSAWRVAEMLRAYAVIIVSLAGVSCL